MGKASPPLSDSDSSGPNPSYRLPTRGSVERTRCKADQRQCHVSFRRRLTHVRRLLCPVADVTTVGRPTLVPSANDGGPSRRN